MFQEAWSAHVVEARNVVLHNCSHTLVSIRCLQGGILALLITIGFGDRLKACSRIALISGLLISQD